MYTQPKDRDLCFLDVETTGLDPHAGHVLVEVAVVRTSPDASRVVDVYSHKIMPSILDLGRAQAQALKVNGFSTQKWERDGALPVADVLPQMFPVMDEAVVVGHRVLFDIGFYDVAREALKLPRPSIGQYYIDTSVLAWPYLKAGLLQNLRLEHLCQYFGVKNKAAHTALADVMATAEVYRCMMQGMTRVAK